MEIKPVSNPAQNPLFKHFRQPAIYLSLPSQGKFWPEGSIDLPVTGGIPIYPMTVKDEITLKTPDALLSGVGVVEVIHSCCPNVKDAWQAPLIDVDALLIAIRLASYGNDMDIDSTCPKCKQTSTYSVNLRNLLDSIHIPDYPVTDINGLKFNFRPQTFRASTEIGTIGFEQQRLLNAIASSTLTDEEKNEQFKTIFPKLTNMNIMSLVNCIDYIVTNDDTKVDNPTYIKEFVTNADRNTYNTIKEQIEQQAKNNAIQSFDVKCTNCENQYATELTFDQSSFFV